ncbi:hypothetical protein ACMXYQ_01160 [Neptuniibacter sp. PT34_22]|uniref:hypothetical protein n=1 Tax=Neptuniibacter sp. PT34_22 TaxID=3398205 RepID=UPI0039F578E9
MRFLAYVIILSASGSALAESTSCADKFELYAKAQTTWQHESTKRAVQLLPEHAERIKHYRDTQLLSIERRVLAVKLALKHTPDKVQTWGSINNWIDLSPELEAELAQYDPNLSTLSQMHKKMTTQPEIEVDNNFHRTFQKAALSDDAFRQLMDNFNLRSRDINSMSCEK